jgi:hypothetical protein
VLHEPYLLQRRVRSSHNKSRREVKGETPENNKSSLPKECSESCSLAYAPEPGALSVCCSTDSIELLVVVRAMAAIRIRSVRAVCRLFFFFFNPTDQATDRGTDAGTIFLCFGSTLSSSVVVISVISSVCARFENREVHCALKRNATTQMIVALWLQ